MNDKQLRNTLRHADPSELPAPGRERVWARIEEQSEDAEHETFTVTQTRSHDWMHAVTAAAALAITIGCAGAGAFLLRRPDRQGAGEIVDMLASAEETSAPETTVPVEEEAAVEETAVPTEETAPPVEETAPPVEETAPPVEETATQTDAPLQWNGPNEEADSVPIPYFGAAVWVDLTAEFTGDETFYLFDGQGTVTLCKAYDGRGETLRYELRDRGQTEFPDLLLYRGDAQEPEVMGMAVTDFTTIELYPQDGQTVTLHYVCDYDPSMHFYSNHDLMISTSARFNYFSGGCVDTVTAVIDPDDLSQVILYVEYVSYDPETYTVGRFTAKGENLDLTMEPMQ